MELQQMLEVACMACLMFTFDLDCILIYTMFSVENTVFTPPQERMIKGHVLVMEFQM